jgi:gliding motility-associated-like protein
MSLLFVTGSLVLTGQETISADRTTGCDTLEVEFTLVTSLQATDYSSIEWNFGDDSVAVDSLVVSHRYTVPGSYRVTCRLDDSKVITLDTRITVSESPYAEILFRDVSQGADAFRYALYPAYYQAGESDSLSYLWTLPDTSQPTDSAVTYEFGSEGLYPVTLQVTNRFGCAFLAARTIPVSSDLMVPNVFSPNGDKTNDLFEVSTQGDYLYSFRVYTRNGVMIFYSRSSRIVWDGRTSAGQEVPEGIYYYVIESDETPRETQVAGSVHLYR